MASLFGRSITRIAAQGVRTLLMLFFLDEGKEATCAYPFGGHRYQAVDAKSVV
jgi:hypothetical protein